MHALPFVVALLSAAMLAPAVLRTLQAGGHTKANYRSRLLAYPFGVLTLAAALVALIPLALLANLTSAEVFHPELLPSALYALGVIALGLIDDTLGDGPPGVDNRPPGRGWRGHARAVLRGEPSTGALKAA